LIFDLIALTDVETALFLILRSSDIARNPDTTSVLGQTLREIGTVLIPSIATKFHSPKQSSKLSTNTPIGAFLGKSYRTKLRSHPKAKSNPLESVQTEVGHPKSDSPAEIQLGNHP